MEDRALPEFSCVYSCTPKFLKSKSTPKYLYHETSFLYLFKFTLPTTPPSSFNITVMASAALTQSSPHDLATFIKHNPPCDAQGVIQRDISELSPDTPPSDHYSYTRTHYRTTRNNTTIICADPRITEDLLVLLKDATTDEHALVEKIEVHEIYI